MYRESSGVKFDERSNITSVDNTTPRDQVQMQNVNIFVSPLKPLTI